MSVEERTWTGPSAPERLNLLRQAKSIAIVGASDKPSRASYFVATYLQSSTRYKVYFVNPVVKEILGQPTYPSLADLPESPDIVVTCRASWTRPSPPAPKPSGCSWAPGMRTLPRRPRPPDSTS